MTDGCGALADFGAFYARTYPRAYRVAFALLGDAGIAEDVTQDAYLAAYRERAHYRGTGPPEAWLHRIVVNTARSALRRQRVRFILPIDPRAPEPAAIAADPDFGGDELTDALLRLDLRSRSAVILRYYLDLDYAAIGSFLGTSPDNVGVILSRALARLQSQLQRQPRAAARPGAVREARHHG